MRKLIAGVFITLDGVVEDPGGFGETGVGGWALDFFEETARVRATEALLASSTMLMGRTTYEVVEKAWSANTGPYAEAMTVISKAVVTRTLRGRLPWNATALNGEAEETVARLKQEPGGPIVMYGSSTLLRTLLRHGLVDELNLGVHPVVAGQGRRLLEDAQGGTAAGPLRFVSATPSPSGVVTLTYAP